MIFFSGSKGTPTNKISVINIEEITEQSLSLLVKKSMDGEIEGISEVEYYTTHKEFIYNYMSEFVLQFNNVIGSIHPDSILTMTMNPKESKVLLTSANNIKIEILI